jgi:Rps23 Pro-64 3,4-dihydroxylase Tpa1-like proline 4-hydroxylase
MSNYVFLKELYVDYDEIKAVVDDKSGWVEIAPEEENRGYVQYYKQYEPQWLKDQLLPIWSYMGLLVACRAGEYLPPHVDNGRTCAILIPCSESYKNNTLDFYHMPDWKGSEGDWQDWKQKHNGSIIESVMYKDPILFKNIPHGVDNTKSKHPRINFSVCFMPPYTFDVVKDLYDKGNLIV